MKKYEQIASQILKRINSNEFKESKKLPTEEQFMKEYNISRNTIRNAEKILIKTGLIYPIQGSGMFIRENKRVDTVFLSGTRGITLEHSGKNIKTKCLKLELIEADENLAKTMQCELNTPIYYIERLRTINEIPYAIEYTYYNKNIVRYLSKEIAEKSIFHYLKNDIKLSFGFADKYISASKLNINQSKLLKLKEDDPAIVIEDTVYLSNGTLFNSSIVYYNYKLANFYISAD